MQTHALRHWASMQLSAWWWLLPLLALALAAHYLVGRGVIGGPARPTASLSVARDAALALVPAEDYNRAVITPLGKNRFLVSVVTTELAGSERIEPGIAQISHIGRDWTLCYRRTALAGIAAQPVPVRLEFEVRGFMPRGEAFTVAACGAGAKAPAKVPWRGF